MIDANCPWGNLAPAKLSFCEAPLCAIVHRPSETYSSLAFCLAGLYIYKKAGKNDPYALIFALLATLIGINSALLHATSSRLGELLDVSSMFALMNFCIVIGIKRKLQYLSGFSQLTLFILFTLISSFSLILDNEAAGSAMFGTLVLMGIVLEWVLFKSLELKTNYKPLILAISSLLLGWGIWWLDILRIVCNPDNHFITGHALWHICNAIGIIYLWKFFHQFEYKQIGFFPKINLI